MTKKPDLTAILQAIDERQDELYSLLASLIKINSENFSTYGRDEEISRYIEDLCLSLGLETERYSPLAVEGFTEHPDYLAGRGLESRYNVTARLAGEENDDDLMLMAHLDTVEIGDRANWTVDPFGGEIIDGKIYGRGACDDKYAIAASLFIIKILGEAGFTPKKNLLFTAYCDEEYGGSHGALAAVLRYPTPRIVNLDGREDQIWHCASGGGVVGYRYAVKETVDSAAEAAEAIPTVLRLIGSFAKRRHDELAANPYYMDTHIPDTALRYMEVRAGNRGMDLGVGELSFTYYTDRTREEIERELTALDRELSAALAPLGIESLGFTPETRFFHYAHCAPDSEDILAMCKASLAATGKEITVCGSCLSDLSVISKFGSDRAYAFGAGHDFSTAGGAHQPNEFIACETLLSFTKTLAAFILDTLA